MDKVQNEVADLIKAHDQLTSLIEATKLGSGGDEISADQKEYAKDFAAWTRTGRGDEKIEDAVASGKIKAATSVGVDSDGGYTAPVEWDRTITDKRVEISEMRMYAGVQSVSGQGFSKIYNLRGTASGWVGETEARPETATSDLAKYSFAFGQIYANAAATPNILQDSEIDVAAWMPSPIV